MFREIAPHARITEELAENILWIEEEEEGADLSSEPLTELEGEIVTLPPAPKRISLSLFLTIMFLAILVISTIGIILYPLLFGTATVTISPVHKQVVTHATVSLPADQVFSHQEKTVTVSGPATGHGHQDATYAHGTLTFYNAALSPQTLPAGTLLIGSSGMHILTDSNVTIPAGNFATNGEASVQGHVTTIGSGGNIDAGDVSEPCCRENIFVQSAAFWGGQDAQDFSTVREEDVTGLATQSIQQAKEQVISEIQKTIPLGEAITPLTCQETITPSSPVGAQATQVSVTAKEDCQAASYIQTKLTPLATKQLVEAARTTLGSHYMVERDVMTHVDQAQMQSEGNTILFSLTVKGEAVYHFSRAEIRSMQQLIAEKKQEDALLLLLGQKGVSRPHIQVANNWGTLPANIRNITITVQR